MRKMKIVFDLDDTICRTENRDYTNSSEISAVVSKIRELSETLPDAEIVVHTARGMASCNGDVKAAEEKNRPTVEKWLSEHGIKVDEIVFGKPIADIYVDDKGMTADDFAQAEIQTFHGFSGADVTRIGKVIIKEADNVNVQAKWYREAKEHYRMVSTGNEFSVRVPQVYSVTLGKLYMQYVDGETGTNCVDEAMIWDIVKMIISEPTLAGENDVESYAKYVMSRAASVGLGTDIGDRLRRCDQLKRRTFCHGDLSLQNIIREWNRSYALIDPSPKPDMDSWILDAAKLRASLNILDEVLEGKAHPARLVETLDRIVGAAQFLDSVKLVEESHIIRVWYYAKKLGKTRQEKLLEDYYRAQYGG